MALRLSRQTWTLVLTTDVENNIDDIASVTVFIVWLCCFAMLWVGLVVAVCKDFLIDNWIFLCHRRVTSFAGEVGTNYTF